MDIQILITGKESNGEYIDEIFTEEEIEDAIKFLTQLAERENIPLD